MMPAVLIICAAIGATGAIIASLIQKARDENTSQHAEGRKVFEDIRSSVNWIRDDVHEVKSDIKDVKGDVRSLTGRVVTLEDDAAEDRSKSRTPQSRRPSRDRARGTADSAS